MKILSVNFWLQALASAFITMVCFYILKRLNTTVKVPVVSEIIENA